MARHSFHHLPVMPEEVLTFLNCHPGGVYVDATLGGGGHAHMILSASAPNGFLIGIDRDSEALKAATIALKDFGKRVKLVCGNFRDVQEICEKGGKPAIDGVLMDLGVSSYHLDAAHRGFSFRYSDDPLDMRMNQKAPLKASDVLNEYPENTLRDIISLYGEERWAAAIAREIAKTRTTAPFLVVEDLVMAIKRAMPAKIRHGKIHMATRTFQALRIFINDELASLKEGLEKALSLLSPGGRMVVISFHSLEDRIVKHTFRDVSRNTSFPDSRTFKVLTRHPAIPTPEEIKVNPRARSAKLRAIERVSHEKS